MAPRHWARWLREAGQLLPTGADPFPNLFTESFTLPEASFLVLPGLEERITYILRRVAEAAEATDLAADARALSRSALAISGLACRRAALGRGLRSAGGSRDRIEIPSPAKFEELKQSVRFDSGELQAAAEGVGGSLAALAPLIRDVGSIEWDGDPMKNPAVLRPLLRLGDAYVLVAPHAILSATRTALIGLVVSRERRVPFTDAFRRSVFESIVESMGWMRLGLVRPPAFGRPDFPCAEAVFELDTEKLVQALLLVDTLDGYSPEEPFGKWDTHLGAQFIERRLAWADQKGSDLAPGTKEILHLVLFQGVGRHMTSGLTHESRNCVTLPMNGQSLETIALLEGGEPLALWQFAQARDRLRARARVIAFSPADEFELYRSKGHSYYMSDDQHANFVSISSGLGETSQAEVQRQRDFHGVTIPWEGGVREVTLLSGDGNFPLYVIWDDPSRRVAMLLERLPLPIWIMGPSELDDSEHRGLSADLAEMIAFWLWEMRPGIEGSLAALAGRVKELHLEFGIDSPAAWQEVQAEGQGGEAVSVEVVGEGRLAFRFKPATAALVLGPDNRGERELVRAFLQGLGQLVFKTCKANAELTAERIGTLIDAHAPLGLKKKFLMLRADLNPRLLRGALPPFRPVQASDTAFVLDDLGGSLSTENWWQPGRDVEEGARNEVVKKAVARLFKTLEDTVASLRPDGLVEWLVSYNEAIVREEAQSRLHMPTRMACFEGEAGIVARLREEMPRINQAALSSRFLIEYVVARPPTGKDALSLAQYDRLLAVSSEIINWGMASDTIRYSQADLPVSMLASGRLGIERKEYTRARQAFFGVFYEAEVERGVQSFNRHWRATKGRSEQKSRTQEMDAACAVEFGVTLTELVTFLSKAIVVGLSRPNEAKVMLHGAFVDAMRQELDWTTAKVEQTQQLLTSRARAHFLAVKPPFVKEDVYPWRFNRALSYLRRPLLLRANGEADELVWGIRHLDGAAAYLVNLCFSGRLKSRSPEMKRVVGKLQHESGEVFNDKVADLYEEVRGFVVRRRVKKIGGVRLERSLGHTLGDIDVLAADPRRRLLLAIETKDMEVARTPAELANELSETFLVGLPHASAVDRHLERVAWLRKHLRETLEWLKLDASRCRRWRVEPLLVVDRELMGPFLKQPPMPVLSYRELRAALMAQGPAAS
jgi:hypothetical protein